MINLRKKPTIIGEKVILRPFQSADYPAMEESLKDPEVLKFTGSPSDFDREKTIDWYNTRNEPSDRLDLAIIDKVSAAVVGEVAINLYDEKLHSMNYRVLIGPKGRNRGLGTEATQLIVDYIFSHTDLNQLTLSVFDFNPRAKQVYEKVGFVLDSIDQNELKFEGEWIDSLNMVLTKETWQNLRH